MAYAETLAWLKREKTIRKHVKDRGETIYGARSIKKQIGGIGRPTFDFDILSKQPKKSIKILEKNFNKKAGGDFYFTKPALHKGTYKLIHKGVDRKKETQDDIHIVDMTKPDRKYKTVLINGIKYSAMSEEIKNKRTSLASKEFAFRHDKDTKDFNRIKMSKRMKRLGV